MQTVTKSESVPNSTTRTGILIGKVALITGGTSGIGRATAELFFAEGAHVIVTGNNPASLQAARAELPEGITVVHADARDVTSGERLKNEISATFGRLDIVFLNAGIAGLAPFGNISEAMYDEHMDTNVKGVVFTLQHLLPLLGAGSSVIVNTSVASLKAAPHLSLYAASKGALSSLVHTLAVELAPRRIRVNAIAPATIHTPIQAKFGLPAEVQQAVEQEYTAKIPLGRFGEAAEVASVALFLASAAASYITGAEIPVDGGLLVS